MRHALADRIDEGKSCFWIALHAGRTQVDKQDVAILLEIGMFAIEFIAATRRESDQQVLVNLFDEGGIATHQANADERLVSGIFRMFSCAEPASHICIHPCPRAERYKSTRNGRTCAHKIRCTDRVFGAKS